VDRLMVKNGELGGELLAKSQGDRPLQRSAEMLSYTGSGTPGKTAGGYADGTRSQLQSSVTHDA
jgi:hypothetical protein